MERNNVLFVRFMCKHRVVSRKMIIFVGKSNFINYNLETINYKLELLEQREQSQTCLCYAES